MSRRYFGNHKVSGVFVWQRIYSLQYFGKAQYQNGRLMRWALALQPYRFVIKAIHVRENVGADFLSHVPCVFFCVLYLLAAL